MVSSLIKKIGNTLSLNKGTKISGQTVLITGGTSGMGLIMAKECAKPVSYTHLTLPTTF